MEKLIVSHKYQLCHKKIIKNISNEIYSILKTIWNENLAYSTLLITRQQSHFEGVVDTFGRGNFVQQPLTSFSKRRLKSELKSVEWNQKC